MLYNIIKYNPSVVYRKTNALDIYCPFVYSMPMERLTFEVWLVYSDVLSHSKIYLDCKVLIWQKSVNHIAKHDCINCTLKSYFGYTELNKINYFHLFITTNLNVADNMH
jgi:hypothetical protein